MWKVAPRPGGGGGCSDGLVREGGGVVTAEDEGLQKHPAGEAGARWRTWPPTYLEAGSKTHWEIRVM